MRRIGTSDYLPYAVVLAALELLSQSPPRSLSTAVQTYLCDELFTEFLNSPGESRNKVHTEGFANAFMWKCNEFFQQRGISNQTDYLLSNIRALADLLGIGVELMMDEVVQTIGSQGTGMQKSSVSIGIVRQTYFILYKTLTKESFMILPCGHLQLRYLVYQALQQQLQSNTLANGEPVAAEVCKVCNAQYSPDLFPIFQSNQLTLSALFDPTWPQEFVCSSCHMRIDRWNISTICGCANTVCMNCMIIARADRNPCYCPGCSEELSNTSGIERAAKGIKNLAEVLPIDWGKGKVLSLKEEKMCNKCNKKQTLDVFMNFEDHLNCWVCASCKEMSLKAENPVCPKCGHEYDTSKPHFQELIARYRAEEQKSQPKTKPMDLPSKAQGTAKKKPIDLPVNGTNSDPMDVDNPATTHPLMLQEERKIPQKRDPSNRQISAEGRFEDPLARTESACARCKGPLRAGQTIPLQDDMCFVCLDCYRRVSNSQNCLGCQKRHSVRDSFTLQTTLLGRESSTFICSKCKLPAPLNCQHPCVSGKPLCVDCCILDIVLRHNSRGSKCSQCRGNFYEELSIDTEVKGYKCSGCPAMMSLYEIAHFCEPSRSFICFPCFKFNSKSKTKQCLACKVIINNKYSGQAGSGSYLPR